METPVIRRLKGRTTRPACSRTIGPIAATLRVLGPQMAVVNIGLIIIAAPVVETPRAPLYRKSATATFKPTRNWA